MAEGNHAVAVAPIAAGNVEGGGVRLLSAREDWEAIASLGLGSLGVLCGLLSVAGLVLGIRSLMKIERSGGVLTGTNLALTGIVVSAVTVALWEVLAALWISHATGLTIDRLIP